MKLTFSILLTLLLSTTSSGVLGGGKLELPTRQVLNLAVSKAIARAAAAHAAENGWEVVIAIVDDASQLIYFERGDGVQPGSIEIAIRKAKTAASFRRPTRVLSDLIADGNTALLSLPDAVLLEGGVPVVWNRQVLGAIGISGVTSQQDGEIGQAGVDALAGILVD